ncbi:MAG TPA: FAD-dependent oxidoreductase [Acidimicrobiales bacterium]|jgi:electron transfer flavoprotein-quinone oxidoreductase|nr:FAD-dependent oxidoreductase [Acidimicrobiales bacterium]
MTAPGGAPGSPVFDAVVVGAGPAGSAAALALARAGRSVVLVERGPFPGAKNVYGGVVYGRVLDEVVPGWWSQVPVERWVVRRSTMMMTGTQSVSVDYRSAGWGEAPYNGMTTLRSRFDSWLAAKAVEAGALLVTSTVATHLLRDAGGRVVGVRTDREQGELWAKVVVACDGVNSFLAKEAGLLPVADASHHTLGVKEVLELPRQVIDERFGLRGDEGVDIEMLGCTRGIPGGGFLYTNADSVSLGVVLSLTHLAEAKVRPEELIADLRNHPSIAPYLRDATLREYSAHLIPEGGYDAMPVMVTDGMLVAGDAAGMTLAAGIWLEGVNFAIGSGLAAGRAIDRAIATGDCSARGLASYRADLEGQFVLADHRRLRRAPGLVLSERVQQRYPGLVCDLVEGMFTVTNPIPKRGAFRITRSAAARHGVKLRQLVGDTARAARIFG